MSLQNKKRACKIGEIFEDVKVEKILYGGSFLIKLNDSLHGFLHKSNIPKEDEDDSDEEPEEETKKDEQENFDDITLFDMTKDESSISLQAPNMSNSNFDDLDDDFDKL